MTGVVYVAGVAVGRLAEGREGGPVRGHDLDLATELGRETSHERLQPDGPVDPVRHRVGRVIEALLLEGRDDRFEPAAHDPVHDEPDQQQHDEHRDPEEQPEPPGQGSAGHAGSRVATSRYPVCGTVSMSHGCPASSPSLRRRFATWTSTTRS